MTLDAVGRIIVAVVLPLLGAALLLALPAVHVWRWWKNQR